MLFFMHRLVERMVVRLVVEPWETTKSTKINNKLMTKKSFLLFVKIYLQNEINLKYKICRRACNSIVDINIKFGIVCPQNGGASWCWWWWCGGVAKSPHPTGVLQYCSTFCPLVLISFLPTDCYRSNNLALCYN